MFYTIALAKHLSIKLSFYALQCVRLCVAYQQRKVILIRDAPIDRRVTGTGRFSRDLSWPATGRSVWHMPVLCRSNAFGRRMINVRATSVSHVHTERTCRKPCELRPFHHLFTTQAWAARIFFGLHVNECIHTGSSSWASSRNVAWAAVKRFLRHCAAHAQLKWKHTFDKKKKGFKSAQNAQNLHVVCFNKNWSRPMSEKKMYPFKLLSLLKSLWCFIKIAYI